MTNNPKLHYKPGLTMDAPIQVTMAAADWAILMAWHAGLEDEVENGVRHIVYGVMAEQLKDMLYSQESIKAAEAHYHDRPQPPFLQLFGGLVGQPGIRAEDAEDLPRCPVCNRVVGAPTAPCLMCPDHGV